MATHARSNASWTPPGFSRWSFNFVAILSGWTGSCEVEVPAAKSPVVSRWSWRSGSCEVEVPPAKSRWCPAGRGVVVAVKLKYHRLKPVVSRWSWRSGSCEVEVPPAKAGGVPRKLTLYLRSDCPDNTALLPQKNWAKIHTARAFARVSHEERLI